MASNDASESSPALAETQLYEIKAAAGKGLGVFATQAIKCGTRIMAEKPIIHIKQGDPTIRESVDAYLHLSQAEQTVFISLHHYISPNLHSWKQFFLAEGVKEEDVNAFVHVMAVYEVNSFPADDGSILCPEASRMNHSCLPNVHHSWNKSRRCLTVHALRDIAAGEEIQTSYVELCLNSRQREKALDEYGFKCGCAACDATTDLGRVSNARRDQLYKVDKELNELVKGTRPMQRLQQILNALVEEKGLLSEEGLENIRLTLTYRQIAQCYAGSGNFKDACHWQKQAVELQALCTGTDSDGFAEDEKRLKEYEAARLQKDAET